MPEDFLAANTNVFDYCGAVKAKGGWFFEERHIENTELITNRLQKIVRYYISTDGSKIVKCNKDGREIQIEAGQWLQTTANKLSKDAILTSIDNKFYLESIYKEINQIEKVKSREFKQLTLF